MTTAAARENQVLSVAAAILGIYKIYTLTLEIKDWLPESLNKGLRAHRMKRDRQNKAWDSYIAAVTVRQRPKAPLERARIHVRRHSHRFLDFDGLVGSLKPVIDALVTAGILKDDSWGVLGAWEADQAFRPKKSGTLLEIQIREID